MCIGMALRLAVIFVAICAFAAAIARADDPPQRQIPGEVLETIAQCLSAGKEIVMAREIDKIACVDRETGDGIAERAGMPLDIVNPQAVCRDDHDVRVLPGGLIKQVAVQTKYPIAPSGIRILGAVYCDSVDLVGLDLPFSIVLDRSLFVEGINARNLKIRGDFSIDRGASLKSLLLNRARIDGSVYAQSAFVYRLIASDTNVAGSFHLNESLVLRDVQFFRTTLSGDLSIATSALSSFLLQSSHVGGLLDLNDSEVRCGYYVKASDIGYVMAVNAGFGVYKSSPSEGERPAADYPWWRRSLANPTIKKLFASAAIKQPLDAEINRITRSEKKEDSVRGCEETRGSFSALYFFDNRVQTTFCLRAFEWLAPEKDTKLSTPLPISILGLNGSRINNNLIIDLSLTDRTDAKNSRSEQTDGKDKHKLEGIGVAAGALIFNFPDNPESYFTYLDNFTFDRVHKPNLTCDYQRGQSENRLTVGEIGAHVELPSVDEVLKWLEKNEAKSSQPFTAFADAFEHAGVSAVPLRIKVKTKELLERLERWLSLDWNRSVQTASTAAHKEILPRTLESNRSSLKCFSPLWTWFGRYCCPSQISFGELSNS